MELSQRLCVICHLRHYLNFSLYFSPDILKTERILNSKFSVLVDRVKHLETILLFHRRDFLVFEEKLVSHATHLNVLHQYTNQDKVTSE